MGLIDDIFQTICMAALVAISASLVYGVFQLRGISRVNQWYQDHGTIDLWAEDGDRTICIHLGTGDNAARTVCYDAIENGQQLTKHTN